MVQTDEMVRDKIIIEERLMTGQEETELDNYEHSHAVPPMNPITQVASDWSG